MVCSVMSLFRPSLHVMPSLARLLYPYVSMMEMLVDGAPGGPVRDCAAGGQQSVYDVNLAQEALSLCSNACDKVRCASISMMSTVMPISRCSVSVYVLYVIL